jgi:serine/threonine protein kinase
MPSEAVQQFLEQGQRSGLLSTAVAQGLIAQIEAAEQLTADQVAAQMIENKVLTPYQAEQLLAGHGDECLIAGRYRILEKLGEGGMGAVYKAHDSQLDRDVAVKVLRARSLNDADAIARFQREARALAKLSHPNIIQAYDNGEDKGRYFLVMEYVEGASLSAILREQGAIPPTLAADLIYQAAIGLQHAHGKGLVHRDLKPANLLLSPAQPPAKRPPPAAQDRERPAREFTTSYAAPAALGRGIVKILDLGLARFLHDQLGDSQVTKEGIGVGTPDYMAPEQFRDALHADARTDIYGLGCTLYQLISGTVPFPGSSFSEKADAHAKKEPIPLEERCPEIPAGLAFVVSKMMAKHPADRFQTAAEVAEALAPYVAGASHSMILLRQTMRFHAGQLTIRAPKGRKRLLAWAGGILAAACFVGLFILAWPSMFPGRPGGSPDGSQSPSTAPGPQASEPSTRKVVTIQNGLTVAKDGTGQYTTIGEALEKVKPGETIQVLDAATYQEAITINDVKRHTGIVLEAVRGATLVLVAEFAAALAIDNVPHVTVRGFRFQFSGGSRNSVFLSVKGHCPGVLLENLEVKAAAIVNGIWLNSAWSDQNDHPIVIRNCLLQVGYDAIVVLGHPGADETKRARGIAIRDNKVFALRGVRIVRGVQDVQLAGNVFSNCGQVAVQIEPASTLCGILIANNTVVHNGSGLRIWDESPITKLLPNQVTMANNLFFGNNDGDVLFVLGEGQRYNPGDGLALIKTWTFAHNWRDLEGNEARFIIPLAKNDKKLEQKDRPPAVISERDFLRPAKDSPLAKAGTGGDLPSYVGAVPPEGAEPWDWQKTWDARARKVGQQEGKTDKD